MMPENKKRISIGILAIILALAAGGIFYFLGALPIKKVAESPIKDSNIIVSSQRADDEVSFPFKVEGEARVFENVLNVRLKEKNGEILFEDIIMANSPDMGQFGPFESEIDYLFKKPKDQNVVLEAYWLSPKDGSELDLVSIPLRLVLGETDTLKVFFNNNILDPEFSCNKVFPVERVVPKNQSPARTSLELLLRGTISKDRELGFFTNINQDVKIQKLTIENGVAKVDFDDQLEFQVGGSCRVSAIRAEITQTLKQFPTVTNVIISINGRTEDILQP